MPAEKYTKFIIDASMVLAFLLPDERQTEAIEIFDQYTSGKIELIAPNLLLYEIINGLKGAVLRKRINFQTTNKLIEQFLELIIPTQDIELVKVLEISVKKDLSVYDASYLWLAQVNKTPLLTLDQKLRKLAS